MKTTKMVKLAVSSGLIMSLSCATAFAGWHGGGGYPHGGGARYHYHGDHWQRIGWFGFGAAVAVLTVGALVEALPPRHTTVIVGSEPYYYYDGTYFRPTPGGYVVVPAPVARPPVYVVPPPAPVVVATPAPVAVAAPAPVVVAAPAPVVEQAAQDPLVVTVNIPTLRGTYAPVTLRRSGSGFVGPQGEYYPEFPKVEQLRLMYGQ